MKKWCFRGGCINFNRPFIMGILNISPESFSGDGGGDAVSRALSLIEQGADIIDIGGCSTAPHHKEFVSEETELSRVLPVVKELVGKVSMPISVDTFRPNVARAVAEVGVEIINDVSGIINPEMAEVVKTFDCGWVITHTADIVGENTSAEVRDTLKKMVKDAENLGVPVNNICVDLGIGFNKENKVSAHIIRDIETISALPYPLMVGLSRKRVIGEYSGIENAEKRDIPSLAANAYCAQRGGNIFRVHNVEINAQYFNTWGKING
ncbi:MAG: dihydropteroate synthase [Clostridia bacterium]|nr:dihydropteroate synthase [Clostridia bacterium]